MCDAIKGIVKAGIVYAVVGASMVIGYNTATTVWNNGLGDKVAKVSKKLLTKNGEA